MTSKEALLTLQIYNNRFIQKGEKFIDTKPMYENIEKDLEVLEILKKHIKLTPYKTVSGFKDEGMTDEEYEIVKEWFEDNKQV